MQFGGLSKIAHAELLNAIVVGNQGRSSYFEKQNYMQHEILGPNILGLATPDNVIDIGNI